MYNNKKKMEDNLIELDRRAAEAQDETTRRRRNETERRIK